MATGSEVSSLSFLALLETHRDLDELFLRHQESLLALNLEQAARELEEYEQRLLRHMAEEEDWLLPIYGRAGAIPGGALELFTGEHRKMREFVTRFKKTLAALRSRLGLQSDWPRDLKRELITLLDQQTLFKHLVEHHGAREETILYPALDRVTSEPERAELLKRCASLGAAGAVGGASERS